MQARSAQRLHRERPLFTQFRTGPLPMNLDAREVARALDAGLVTALDLNDAGSAEGFLKELEYRPESSIT